MHFFYVRRARSLYVSQVYPKLFIIDDEGATIGGDGYHMAQLDPQTIETFFKVSFHAWYPGQLPTTL